MSRYERACLMFVVATLDGEKLRVTELQRRIPGLSQRMLSLTVRRLERDGLVLRTVYAEPPPRVEHELTASGRNSIPPAVAIAEWAVEHHPAITLSQAAYDAARRPRD